MVCQLFVAFAGQDKIVSTKEGSLLTTIIDSDTIEAYLKTRPSNHNYNIHRKELRAIFNYGIKKKFLTGPNPCDDIEKLPSVQPTKYIPSEEDILKVLVAAGDERPLLLVLLHTLARISEILKLRWEDVNSNKSTIRLWTRKRSDGNMEYDNLPMNSDLQGVLWDLWQKKEQDEWVFYNKKEGTRYNRRAKVMPGICKRAKVKPFGFHAIRHFAASYLADQDKISKKAISVSIAA